MPQSIITYDKDLPEVPGRCPWIKPTSYLVKDITADTGWSENKSGRRPSNLLLITRLRQVVDEWRESGYPGISEIARRLFEYWFEEDHELNGFAGAFHYHFCARASPSILPVRSPNSPWRSVPWSLKRRKPGFRTQNLSTGNATFPMAHSLASAPF
jgi:hypothetical protein